MCSLPDRLVIPCLACALAALWMPPAPTKASGAQAQSPSALVTEHRFTRTLTRADYERLIEQPFDVPAGTRRVEVEYEVSGREARTVVDLGLRSPSGLRGWSGGGRSGVWVSALGAMPGYLSGAIEPGRWAVLLGVPNIRAGQRDTVQIVVRFHATDLPDGPVIAGRGPGWFVGDLHAHSAHSDGRATSRRGAAVGTPPHRVFDAAVAARLDFVALTDHNTASHWLDADRLQPFYDDLLLLHAREVTTYRGHANTIGERSFHDFRLPDQGERRIEMGAAVASGAPVRLVATVVGADGQQVQWIQDGGVVATHAVRDGPMTLERPATPGAWFAGVVRDGSGPTVMSSAIYVGR